MDTDLRAIPSRARRGVAMFVVLGAILLVTLFGFVGITLADRDQTLSGDLNDIKSRDEAAYSGLQIAINRLTADPDSMVAMLNTFIRRSYALNGNPDSAWISLDSTNKLHLEQNKPDWFSLSNSPGDQTAARVRIIAVQHADPTPEIKFDSARIFVTLQCFARGRHGDEKVIQAAYRIHGVTGDNLNQPVPFTIPRHSFYLGGTLNSPNMGIGAQGSIYVGNAGNSFLNSGAGQAIEGDFQWNDNLQINTGAPVHIKGDAVIHGKLKMNAYSSLQVDGDLQLDDGFIDVNSGCSFVVGGNAYINGSTSASAIPEEWKSNKGIRVGKSLYFCPSNYDSTGKNSPPSLIVGGDAWIVRSGTFTIGAADSFFVGGDLFYGESTWVHSFATRGGALYKVGGSLIAGKNPAPAKPTTVILPQSIVADTVQVDGALAIRPGQSLTVGSIYQAGSITGSILGGTQKPAIHVTSMNWKPKPTPESFGIDTNLSKTAPSDNPMDSVKVDMVNSPKVYSALIPLAPLLNNTPTATRLNAIYDSLRTERKLINGYMALILNYGNTYTVQASTEKFKGKMILVVEGKIIANSKNWPTSNTKDNIQVIAVRKQGEIENFGWNGMFAGLFYWENPCKSKNLDISGEMYGAILLGTSLKSPGYGYTNGELCGPSNSSVFTPNTGGLTIYRDTTVFMDIGRNLPGVLAPAKDANGKPISIQGTLNVYYYTQRLRLVHNKPFFEPIGVFR